MKITLQRDDIYRLNNIVHRITKRPNCKSLHYIEFRGKPALALHQHDWSLVMPISGRKPKTPFKVKYRPFRLMDLDADEKVVVDIDTKKRLGKIMWTIAGRRAAFSPFAFTDLDYHAMTPPSENDDTTEYPKSLLQSFGVCSRLLRSATLFTLAYVHITPGGELCCSDGRQALGVMTPYKFECEDTTLMYCGRLFTSNDIRRRKSFRMGFVGRTVHFDFGDFHYWCHPSIDRFPNMDNTIPKEETIQTRLTLDPRDAIFLKKHLMNLPGRKEDHAPITLLCDYDNTVSVHGSETNCSDTKALLLTRSSYSGDAYALRTNRKYLFDAVSRGCRDFRLGTRYPLALMEKVRLCWIQLSGSALPLESERPSPPVVLLRSNENPNEKSL